MASKRLTLTQSELEIIKVALQRLRDEHSTLVDFEVVKVGKRVYNDLIERLTLPGEEAAKGKDK